MPVFARRLLLASVLGSVVCAAQAGAPMGTPSSFSVTPQGAASYQIPIRVAPGIAGVEPKLSFGYNSQGGNGVMGVGWSLSGLSLIMRCPQTIAQDGTHGRVDFTANDRFCLDGKRLKLFDPNNAALPYWAAGAANEYRTEIASFTRVVANGTAGLSGPAWFKVWTKSGEIIEYGNTPDSQITGNGHFTPLIWAVNKISDRYGNYITFSYKQTNGYLEYYPTQINYTGNASLSQAPNQRVLFNYENRPATDVIRGYGPGGIPVLTGQELLSVQVLAGTNNSGGPLLVRQYNLLYSASTASGRSLLQSLNECSPATPTVYLPPPAVQGGLCRPLLSFTWPSGSDMLTPDPIYSAASVGGWNPVTVQDYVADINGDGKADLVRIWYNGSNFTPAYAQVTVSNGNGFTSVSNNTVGPWMTWFSYPCNPIAPCTAINGLLNQFGDVNGDGKADLVRISNTGSEFDAQLWLSNGTGFSSTPAGLISNYGDFSDPLPTYYDQPQDPSLSWQQTNYPFQALLEDISGDGRADLVLVGLAGTQASVVAALSTGTGFAAPTTTVSGPSNSAYEGAELTVLGGDVDGDGRADAIELYSQCQDVTDPLSGQVTGATCPTRIARLLISNGSTLVDAADVVVGAGGSGDPSAMQSYFAEFAVDMNGDGKTDLIRIRNSNPGSATGTAIADIWLSTGTTLVKTGSYTVGSYGSGTEFIPIDVNGDGRTDLVVISNNNGQAKASIYLSQGYGFASTPDVTWTSIGGWNPGNVEDLPMDVNGDGRIDLVRLTNVNNAAVPQIVTQQGTPFDVITSFGNGLGSTLNLNYQTLSELNVPKRALRMQAYHMAVPAQAASLSIPPVYTKGSSSSYPLLDFEGPMKVVAWVETDSGQATGASSEGANDVSYAYSSGVMDLSGRGFLGFAQVQQQDNTANIITTTNYDQTFPYIGMITSKQTTAPLASHTLLGTTTNTPTQVADDNGSPYPYVGTSVDQAYGLTTGNALPSVTTQSVFDLWGNATQVTVTTTDPANANDSFKTITGNTYKAADTTNWILGRLSQSQVTNTVSATPVTTPPSLAPFSLSIGPQSGGTSQTLGPISATATVNATGGVAPVVYSWSGGSSGISASVSGTQVTFSGNFSTYGIFSASFTLNARDAAGRVAKTTYTVSLSNAVSFIPASTNWGTIGAYSDSGDWFTVKNNSASSSILITAHAPVSGPAGVWSWQGQAGYCQPGITVLAGGASCVSFFGMSSLSTPGTYTAADQVSYVAQGTMTPIFAIQQSYSFSVATTSASAASLAFGNWMVNAESSPQTFTLTNNATNGGPLYITDITMVGANPGNFPMSHNCGASIAAGGSCTVSVQFSPQSSTASLSASVQIQGGYDRIQAGVDSGYRPSTTGVNIAIPVTGTGQTAFHTFTSSGSFVVPAGMTSANVLLVGGGGPGGGCFITLNPPGWSGGGGGGGQVVHNSSYAVSVNQTISVTVGGGGAASSISGGSGGSITAAAGQGGASGFNSFGGVGGASGSGAPGGSGARVGFGGGGGGNGGAGGSGTTSKGGNGGNGSSVTINGTTYNVGGGGGAGGGGTSGTLGSGATAYGGANGAFTNGNGNAGTPNTGGGGGGGGACGSSDSGGPGGSGLVVIFGQASSSAADLGFSGCSSTSPTTAPTAATLSCTLSNTGQTAVSSISYSAISGATVSGPTGACAANAACGTVTVTSGTNAGTYSGTLTATPNTGSAASAPVSLVVNPGVAPASLAFSACTSTSPTTAPTAATESCTLSNTGQTAVSSISYSTISGATVSGPTGACAASSTCGTVSVTSGTSAGTYSGTLTATPNTGSAASTAISLVVNAAATPPALAFSACTSTSPTTAPTAATESCTLSNTGQTAVSSIGYSAITGATVSGPTGACGASATCGTVTVTSSTAAGTYSGTLTATPNTGTAASTAVSLVVDTPAALALSACSSTSPTTAPTAATESCTLNNTGQAAVSSISYSTIAGATVNGPTGACAGGATCGTVTVTSGVTAGTYSGTLTATPNTGSAASTAVSLVVNQPPQAALAFTGCSSASPTTTPTPATESCTLNNTGQGAVSSISYSAIAGATVSGPTGACAANATCGTVTITSGTTAGTYSGTLTATPNTGSAASTSVSLVVDTAAALAFSACSSNSPTTTPTAATESCTLSNTGQTAVSSISYSTITGATISGPTGACAPGATCGTVTVTSGTTAGTYSGTLTATPNAGSAASTAVSLVVDTAAALAFSACSSNSPTVAPTAATESCTLSNTGQTAVSSISYSTITGATVGGPTGACAAGATCGTVTVTSGTSAGTYSGTLTATPNTGSATSTSVSLQVNSAPTLSVASSSLTTGNSTAPTAATGTVSLTNSGQTATTVTASISNTSGTSTVSGAQTCAANGGTCSFTVTTGTSAGTYTGSVSFSSSAGGSVPAAQGFSLNVASPYTPTLRTFTSSGSFVVPAGMTSANVLLVGGGGPGGGCFITLNPPGWSGGGGGGGQVVHNASYAVSVNQTINVTVGGSSGQSSISGGTGGTLTAAAGQGGASGFNSMGGTGGASGSGAAGGSGASVGFGGGGGGNGGAGGSGTTSKGGNGGNGSSVTINGTTYNVGGGGGAGGGGTSGTLGSGATAYGGANGAFTDGNGNAGTPNTGGGGGGGGACGSSDSGGAGGSGLVVIFG